MGALVTGKSVSDTAVLEVLDRLKANPKISGVKQLYITPTGNASREVSFAISLSLRGAQ